MKLLYTILLTLLITSAAEAKTYTLGSGKWTDAKIWSSEYPGTTIKAEDVVVISGQVTMNTGIIVEGTLQVEKGACMVGMKDLVILKSGRFVNNGNTVMKRIINEGSINNNLIMEAMVDFDNKGRIDNNSNITAGNNFENTGGNATGNGGAYFANNSILTSPASTFGKNVDVFYGNEMSDNPEQPDGTNPFTLDTKITQNGVLLNVVNSGNTEVTMFRIEKSTDGKNYNLVQYIKSSKQGNVAMTYTDTLINGSFTYYRVNAINARGEEIVLPVATVKIPSSTKAYTLANE